MTPELDEKLCKKYPKLFAQRNKSMCETCMGRGFECGDGWFKLLDTLSYFLEMDGSVEANQVKEKFGTLRFYYSGGNDYTDELIHMFERESAHVCETCGKWSKLRHVGSIYNMCDKCWDKFEGNRKKSSKIILAKLKKENIREKEMVREKDNLDSQRENDRSTDG